MDVHSRLLPVGRHRFAPDAPPAGVVLVLHGGGARRDRMRVSPAQLSVLRMIPIARRIARAGRGRLAVFRLLNSTRGWDTSHTPVDDLDWALSEVAERFGDAPVVTVGHSLGGRAALLGAGRRSLRCAVALNPYVFEADGAADAAGHAVVIAHGTADRIASIQRARTVARRLSRTAEVSFREIEGGKHAMLRHARAFHSVAVDAVRAHLLESDQRTERIR